MSMKSKYRKNKRSQQYIEDSIRYRQKGGGIKDLKIHQKRIKKQGWWRR